ncbi:MAG TPA: endolytic transglycosylase MltG [Coxiellaceae bacterium]|nr:MAG: hypothetical protein A3E81_07860 [Gammaproteobacteria bacterium RIFCSPHIGHO2_12_FULL_36_30]HLB57074.1 endolytic transglycosylase MltG [Coxiellaceae bacterium]
MPKKIFNILFIAFVFIFLYVASVIHDFFRVPLVSSGVTTSIKVYPNQDAYIVVNNLHQQQLIQHATLFKYFIDVCGDRYQLRYGEYEINSSVTAWTLLRNMVHGTGLVKHRLTIVNGWTTNQVLTALASDHNLNQTLVNQPKTALLQALNAPENNVEGLLYPDTYFFTWGNTDISVLKTAYQKMQSILQTDWNNRAPNLPYQNAYQALIVASLIEKETSVDAEKPIIASVIINRLAKNMRLQIDPTVQYGLDKTFGGAITKKDLDTKTPYNTYLIDGLPPTPICMPSQSSIFAALHPAQTDYLYYVATGNGGHNFSRTYAEHLIQVKEYRNVIDHT